MEKPTNIQDLVRRIREGNRRSLAQALSLIESTHPADVSDSELLLSTLYQEADRHTTRRIAISGAPGVGKSTLLESYGLELTNRGLRVAILTVDPTSVRTGGSILADKVRMSKLASNDHAFIRPSASKLALGGVTHTMQNSILLCEAAGYDVVIVETVGVGQSEFTAAEMVDCFVLLLLPTAGDELQGIKRGIMEVSDVVVVTKADIDTKAASRAVSTYASAARYMRQTRPDWHTCVVPVAATMPNGLLEFDEVIEKYFEPSRQAQISSERIRQRVWWFDQTIQTMLGAKISSSEKLAHAIRQATDTVLQGQVHPMLAAKAIVERISISF